MPLRNALDEYACEMNNILWEPGWPPVFAFCARSACSDCHHCINCWSSGAPSHTMLST